MKLDWVNIWDEYNGWYDEESKLINCKHCKHSHSNAPEWEDQMKMIRKIVDKHIKRAELRG